MRGKLSAVAVLILACAPPLAWGMSRSRELPTDNKRNEVRVPHSLEAERRVLGAVLLDNAAGLEVFSRLRRESFFLDSHRAIFTAMSALAGSGSAIDLVILCQVLEDKGALGRVGGAGYVSALVDGVPRVSNVGHYVDIVLDKAWRRALLNVCAVAAEQAMSGEKETGELYEETASGLLALGSESGSEGMPRAWKEVAEAAFTEIDAAAAAPEKVSRMLFGIASLDEKTSGLRKGELAVIVGPTSHGKTLLAMQLAMRSESDGFAGLVFSAEMRGESLAARELAHEAGVPLYWLRRPENLSRTKDAILNLRRASLRERRLWVVDQGITPERVWALCEARKRSGGLDFVIVDYDQLVIEAGIDPDRYEESFFAHQGRFVHQATKIAKRLDLCFILLAQLRKMPPAVKSGGKPSVDDIYGHSAIRNDPHVILWVLRDFFVKNYDKKFARAARVYIVKSRNDATGKVELDFDPEKVVFLDKPQVAEKELEEESQEEKGG